MNDLLKTKSELSTIFIRNTGIFVALVELKFWWLQLAVTFFFCLFFFFHFAYLPGKDAWKKHNFRLLPKKAWSKAEVAAGMWYFRDHIYKGKLVTKNKCSICKLVAGRVLAQRTVPNIRDFFKNWGEAAKKQSQKNSCKPSGNRLCFC